MAGARSRLQTGSALAEPDSRLLRALNAAPHPLPTLMVRRPPHLRGTDIAIYEEDGALYGLDDCGEFRIDPPRGSSEPQDGRCNAVLKLSEQRYGETRYCTKTPYWPADDSDKEPSDYCRHHKYIDMAIENAVDLVKHGAFARNYVVFEKALDATEFLFAVDIFRGLLEMSEYDYDVETEERVIDTGDEDLLQADTVVVELPIPQNTVRQAQANELWYFALDEVAEQRMHNIRLTQGVSTSHTVATADEDGVITDRIEEGAEHHLNLPISRLTKDKKSRLEIGGVEVGVEEDEGSMVFTTGDYVVDLEPPDEEVEEMEAPLTATLEDLEPDDE